MKSGFTLAELASLTGANLAGDPNHLVHAVNSLDTALDTDVSFLANSRYKELLKESKAGVICVDTTTLLIEGKNFLISDNPSETFQKITDLLVIPSFSGFTGIHTSAVIHPSASYGDQVDIGPNVTIDQRVKIGNRSKIHANVSIGPDVIIGEDCIVYPGAILREKTILHNRVIIQPGAIIGSCGFGYLTDTKGQHKKIEQLGNVILEDDVEIGANTTIDRARFKHTTIGKGSKIDNLVQIGHNVQIGQDNIIIAQTGISGSSVTGKCVIFGGQAGVAGHVKIPDYTQIATRGGVTKTLSKGGQYGGNPLQPLHEFHRHKVLLRNIEKYIKKIEELEEKIKKLESIASSN